MPSSVKNVLGYILMGSLLLGTVACGTVTPDDSSKVNTSVVDQNGEKTPEPVPTPEPTVEPESAVEPTPAPEPAVEPTPVATANPFPVPENEGLAFVRGLKVGWNLGNAFDAIDCSWLSDEMEYESAWNGAKTTEALMDAVKEAGFNTIRIPVSWHNHLSDRNNYTISKPWLDRVNEVVDYAVDRDMYVIINIHHDNNTEFLYPDSARLNQSIAYVTAIWKQLSERFRDYDEHLIFNGMNEPRLVGHANEWWIDSASADCRDAIECINKINQAFVDTVRASGGNNASRYLLCPGYDASPDGATNSGYVLPTDPVDNDHHILVSVHAYTPYSFALEDPGTDKWSSSNSQNTGDIKWFMNNLYKKYVSQGTPVLIDEFGARNKNGNLDARVEWASYYVKEARARSMSCIVWDNNAFSGDGELFGLIDRKTCKWKYPEIVKAITESASDSQ